MGHVVAPELTSSRRQGPELRNTWQRRSSPQQGDEVRGRGTRDGAGAHLCREVWQRVNARLAPYLDLELVYGGIRSSGYRHNQLIK
jgi:hypothetical protein